MSLSVAAEPLPFETDVHGVVRIAGTRVTLDTVVAAFNEGATPEEIVFQYSSLQLADVYAVISYYLRHRLDVEDYLRGREEQAALIRAENERRFDPRGIRDRLLERRPR